jgi:hypothetical protein
METIAASLVLIWAILMLLYVSSIYSQLKKLNGALAQLAEKHSPELSQIHYIAVKHDRKNSPNDGEQLQS